MDNEPTMKPRLTSDNMAAPLHVAGTVSESTSLPPSPPHRPTALFTCTLLGIFTFTTVYHAYQHQPILREMHSYLMLLSAFILLQRYQPQVRHHWRACAGAYVRGVVVALGAWVFLVAVSTGMAERMGADEMRARQQIWGECVGWFAVLIAWMFWSTTEDNARYGRELDALRGESRRN